MRSTTERALDWQVDARCRDTDDPDLFFPDRAALPAEALTLCGSCPALVACREHALVQPERFGVWGGLTEAERERLRASTPSRRAVHRPSSWVGARRRRAGA